MRWGCEDAGITSVYSWWYRLRERLQGRKNRGSEEHQQTCNLLFCFFPLFDFLPKSSKLKVEKQKGRFIYVYYIINKCVYNQQALVGESSIVVVVI